MPESIIQRSVLMFDQHVLRMASSKTALVEDEVLLQHFFACLYLCIKLDDRT